MPFNQSVAITNPDVAQSYTIQRTTGAFVLGGYTTVDTTMIPAYGVITVAAPKDLRQVPEGDRVEGSMLFFATQEIMETRPSGLSDTILWRGDNYKIVKVWPYGDYGYWKACGVRVVGN
jgi:hypothetical protein